MMACRSTHCGGLRGEKSRMRAVVQRVSRAKVTVNEQISGEIGLGLLVLLGVGQEDTEADATYLSEKIAGLRIFEDEHGKMNRSVQDVGGSVLAVSQFTLYGDVRRGKRPSFDAAAPPDHARRRRTSGGRSFAGQPYAGPACPPSVRKLLLVVDLQGRRRKTTSGRITQWP